MYISVCVWGHACIHVTCTLALPMAREVCITLLAELIRSEARPMQFIINNSAQAAGVGAGSSRTCSWQSSDVLGRCWLLWLVLFLFHCSWFCCLCFALSIYKNRSRYKLLFFPLSRLLQWLEQFVFDAQAAKYLEQIKV